MVFTGSVWASLIALTFREMYPAFQAWRKVHYGSGGGGVRGGRISFLSIQSLNMIALMLIQGKQIGQLVHVMFEVPECYTRAYLVPIFSALHFLFLYLIQFTKLSIVKDALKPWQKVLVLLAFFVSLSGLFWWAWPNSTISRNNYDRCTASFDKYSLILLYSSDMFMDLIFSLLFILNMRKLVFGARGEGAAGTTVTDRGVSETPAKGPESKIRRFLKHQDFLLVFINLCSIVRLVASQLIENNYLKFLVLNSFEAVRAWIVSHNIRILLHKKGEEKTGNLTGMTKPKLTSTMN